MFSYIYFYEYEKGFILIIFISRVIKEKVKRGNILSGRYINTT